MNKPERPSGPCHKHADRFCHLCDTNGDWEMPIAFNIDGRPMWEPPVLDYSHLIDTEHDQPYTKRREAVLKYTGDVAKTTRIMDFYTEQTLLEDYRRYSEANVASTRGSPGQSFFIELSSEIFMDIREVLHENWALMEEGYTDSLYHVGVEGNLGWKFEEKADGSWDLNTVRDRPNKPIAPTSDDSEDNKVEGTDSEASATDSVSPNANPDEQTFAPKTTQSASQPTMEDGTSHLPSAAQSSTNLVHPQLSSTPGLHLCLRPAQPSSSQSIPLAMRLLSLQGAKLTDDID